MSNSAAGAEQAHGGNYLPPTKRHNSQRPEVPEKINLDPKVKDNSHESHQLTSPSKSTDDGIYALQPSRLSRRYSRRLSLVPRVEGLEEAALETHEPDQKNAHNSDDIGVSSELKKRLRSSRSSLHGQRSESFGLNRQEFEHQDPPRHESKWRKWVGNYWRFIFSATFPLVLLALLSPLLFDSENKDHQKIGKAIFVGVLVITLWLTQTIPLQVTALIQIFLVPMMGLQCSDGVMQEYGPKFWTFWYGGFCLAMCYEFSNLHYRIALKIIDLVGARPKRLLQVVMVLTFFLCLALESHFVIPVMSTIIVAIMKFVEKCLLDDDEFFEDEGLFGSSVGTLTPVESANSKTDLFPKGRDSIVIPFNVASSPLAIDDGPPEVGKRYAEEEIESLTDSKKERNLKYEQWTEDFIRNTKIMLLLACYYSAITVNIIQLSGSATNVQSHFERKPTDQPYKVYPDRRNGTVVHVSYSNWITFAMIPMLLNFVFCYFFIQFWFLWRKNCFARSKKLQLPEELLKKVARRQYEAYKKIKNFSLHEIEVICLSVIQAIFTMIGLAGDRDSYMEIFGWSLTVLIALLMIVLPRKREFYNSSPCQQDAGRTKTVLDWFFIQNNFPWGVLFIPAAAPAILNAALEPQLFADSIASLIQPIADRPPELVLVVTIALATMLAELQGFAQVVSAMVPFFRNYEVNCGYANFFLTFPISIAAFQKFLLPVSCVEAAFVFLVGNMKMLDFVIPGMCMKIASVIILFCGTLSWGAIYLGFRPHAFARCTN